MILLLGMRTMYSILLLAISTFVSDIWDPIKRMILLRGVGCRGQLGVSYSRFCINVSFQTWHEEPWSLTYSNCWFFERWPYVQGCVSIWEGFYGCSDADILCIPFWYTMSIEMTKKIIFKPRESSPRVDGVWTCQIIAIKAFRCKLKKGEPDNIGRYGNHSLHLAMLPSRKSIWFCIVTFRPGRPPPAQRWGTKENYNSIYLVIMVKKSFANRWLLVCLYDGPSLRPTMVSMANDIEMIKMREEWGSSLDLLFSPTRSRYLDLATGINDWLRKVTRSFEFFSSSTGHRSQGIRPCKRILKT